MKDKKQAVLPVSSERIEIAYVTNGGAPDSTQEEFYHKLKPLELITRRYHKVMVDESVSPDQQLLRPWLAIISSSLIPTSFFSNGYAVRAEPLLKDKENDYYYKEAKRIFQVNNPTVEQRNHVKWLNFQHAYSTPPTVSLTSTIKTAPTLEMARRFKERDRNEVRPRNIQVDIRRDAADSLIYALRDTHVKIDISNSDGCDFLDDCNDLVHYKKKRKINKPSRSKVERILSNVYVERCEQAKEEIKTQIADSVGIRIEDFGKAEATVTLEKMIRGERS